MPKEIDDQLADLSSRIKREALKQETALIAQDHRLIRSLLSLLSGIFEPDKRYRLRPAVTALIWCLVPSGAALIGTGALVVSLLTALITFFQLQANLSEIEQVEIQTNVAATQRHWARLTELSTIMRDIDQERNASSANLPIYCEEAPAAYSCFRRIPPILEAAGIKGSALDIAVKGLRRNEIYVPSRELLARIASLTTALKPYRAITSIAEDRACWDGTTPARQRIVSVMRAVESDPDDRVDEAGMNARIQKIYDSHFAIFQSKSIWQKLQLIIAPNLGAPRQLLNCRLLSPERGQVFLALANAGIDLSAAQEEGANFQQLDINGERLDGIVFPDVDLRGSDLANASLNGAIFRKTDMSGVDMRGADVSQSTFVDGVYLVDAVLPILQDIRKISPNFIRNAEPAVYPGTDGPFISGPIRGRPNARFLCRYAFGSPFSEFLGGNAFLEVFIDKATSSYTVTVAPFRNDFKYSPIEIHSIDRSDFAVSIHRFSKPCD